MNNKLVDFAKGLLRSNNILVSKQCNYELVINQVVIYLDALIFNIISIACIISIINNTKKIEKETLPIIRSYIEDKCQFKYKKNAKKIGGEFNTAAFYGAEETMYKAENAGNDILGIKWSEGILRPTIGDQKGGSNKINKMSYRFIKSHINNVLTYHKIIGPEYVISELISIIDHHIKCLIFNMKHCDKELTLTCLNKIIDKNKILSPLK